MFGFRWCGSESERVLVDDSAILNDVLCDGGQPRKDPVLREFLVDCLQQVVDALPGLQRKNNCELKFT